MYRDCFDVLPLTFVINNSDKTKVDSEFTRFQLFFNTIEKHKQSGFAVINQALASHPNLQNKSKTYQKYVLRDCMFDGQNLWVLKPNDLNRG